MQRHERAHIIFQRCRHIARRLAFVKKAYPADAWPWYFKNAGRLSKWNLVCSCWMCRGEKYREKRSYDKARWKKEAGYFGF